jgi:hypothetical protein
MLVVFGGGTLHGGIEGCFGFICGTDMPLLFACGGFVGSPFSGGHVGACLIGDRDLETARLAAEIQDLIHDFLVAIHWLLRGLAAHQI